jgi:predicted dehydrogenase
MTNKSIARVGIIGCGNIGSRLDESSPAGQPVQTHAKAYKSNESFELVALMDSDLSRAKDAQRIWETPIATDDINEFLAQRLDVVSLCTPVEVQFDLLTQILASGTKVIFCEKPVGRSEEETQAVIDLMKKYSAGALVNFIRRFDSELRHLKLEIDSRRLGIPQKILCSYGKGLLNNGSHVLDLLSFYFGAASRARSLGRVADDRSEGVDPTLSAVLFFGGHRNFPVYLTGQDHRNYSTFEMDLFFDKGRVRILDSGRVIEFYEIVSDPNFLGYKSLQLLKRTTGGLSQSFSNGIEEVYSIWAGENKSNSSPVEASLQSQAMIAAIKKSEATRGEEVAVEQSRNL